MLIFFLTSQSFFKPGEMSEWLKEHAWKACVLQKGTVSSNLTLSAKELEPNVVGLFYLRPGFVKLCLDKSRF
jgi:hypothetical protein